MKKRDSLKKVDMEVKVLISKFLAYHKFNHKCIPRSILCQTAGTQLGHASSDASVIPRLELNLDLGMMSGGPRGREKKWRATERKKHGTVSLGGQG